MRKTLGRQTAPEGSLRAALQSLPDLRQRYQGHFAPFINERIRAERSF